jgi:hypothetical protein
MKLIETRSPAGLAVLDRQSGVRLLPQGVCGFWRSQPSRWRCDFSQRASGRCLEPEHAERVTDLASRGSVARRALCPHRPLPGSAAVPDGRSIWNPEEF